MWIALWKWRRTDCWPRWRKVLRRLQKLDISQQDLQHQNALNELKKKTLTLTSQLADEESRVRQQHALALATMGIRVDREDGPALEGFLSQHNGVKAFLWTPPYGYRQIKVVCRKWSVKAGLLKTTFTATFEQVIS